MLFGELVLGGWSMWSVLSFLLASLRLKHVKFATMDTSKRMVSACQQHVKHLRSMTAPLKTAVSFIVISPSGLNRLPVCSSGTRKIDGAGNSVRCRSCPDGAVLDDRTGSCNCRATSSFYDSRTDTCSKSDVLGKVNALII